MSVTTVGIDLAKLVFQVHGVDAREFVKPYVKTNKNDVADADADAICEAVGRPNMRFVPVKHIDQQALLGLHPVRRLREGAHRASQPNAWVVGGVRYRFASRYS